MDDRIFNPFPLVSQKRALKIAAKASSPAPEDMVCYACKPANIGGYNMPPDSEPCWWIPICYGDRVGGGRIMAVSKRTGKILYDGNDGGE